jgi:hypothetical protein
MRVCISAGHKVIWGGVLHSEGAALDMPDDRAAVMIEGGTVTAVKAPKKKKTTTKKSD